MEGFAIRHAVQSEQFTWIHIEATCDAVGIFASLQGVCCGLRGFEKNEDGDLHHR